MLQPNILNRLHAKVLVWTESSRGARTLHGQAEPCRLYGGNGPEPYGKTGWDAGKRSENNSFPANKQTKNTGIK